MASIADSRLRVHASGRYLEHEDGTPFFWLGDTGWALIARYGRAEIARYLAARAATGFTLVQSVVAWDGGTKTESGESPNRNTEGEIPWLERDPAQPNLRYFELVDYVVRTARELDLVMGLLPAWGSYVMEHKLIHIGNARAYGGWLGARYREWPNIVWVLGGDRPATGYEPVHRELAAGLRAGDGGNHLITFHPGLVSGISSSAFFHHEDWLDINMIQTWQAYWHIHPLVTADRARVPAKPVVLGEGAYEEGPEYPSGPITPLLVRRQAYWSFLAGGFHTYGHNDMWRRNSTWAESLLSPGARQLGVLAHLFAARRWWELQPDQALFAHGVGEGKTLNAAARASDARSALVYLSSPCAVRVNLDRLTGPAVRAAWVDPRTGEECALGVYPTEESVDLSTPAGWEDAVLTLDAQG